MVVDAVSELKTRVTGVFRRITVVINKIGRLKASVLELLPPRRRRIGESNVAYVRRMDGTMTGRDWRCAICMGKPDAVESRYDQGG